MAGPCELGPSYPLLGSVRLQPRAVIDGGRAGVGLVPLQAPPHDVEALVRGAQLQAHGQAEDLPEAQGEA